MANQVIFTMTGKVSNSEYTPKFEIFNAIKPYGHFISGDETNGTFELYDNSKFILSSPAFSGKTARCISSTVQIVDNKFYGSFGSSTARLVFESIGPEGEIYVYDGEIWYESGETFINNNTATIEMVEIEGEKFLNQDGVGAIRDWVNGGLSSKQDTLKSGTNIKTINNQSILGSGNLVVGGSGGSDIYEFYWNDLADATKRQAVWNAAENGKTMRLLGGLYDDVTGATSDTVSATLTTSDFGSSDWGYMTFVDQDKLYAIFLCNVIGQRPYGCLETPIGSPDTSMSDTSKNPVENRVIKSYVDTASTNFQTQIGTLSSLTTTDKSNLVNAINEVYQKSGEPFRVKNWAGTFTAEIPTCTEDLANTAIPKMVFSIDDVEGADYQIVGMIAYEVFDAVSGGNRLNVWPVCQFTGNGQKELSVRWMCGGTTRKTARRINAWVLLKHR